MHVLLWKKHLNKNLQEQATMQTRVVEEFFGKRAGLSVLDKRGKGHTHTQHGSQGKTSAVFRRNILSVTR